MRNLFKNNSKVLFNYWFIMFPQFMLRPVPEITELVDQLEEFDTSKKEASFVETISLFTDRVLKNIVDGGPSLLYVIWHDKTQSLLRSLLFTTI